MSERKDSYPDNGLSRERNAHAMFSASWSQFMPQAPLPQKPFWHMPVPQSSGAALCEEAFARAEKVE
jgi:hypothetical protein